MNPKDIQSLHEAYMSVYELDEDKSGSPRPTFMPKSRERDIGRHDDWKDKTPTEWNDKTSEQKKADKLRRRASAVVQTQRRQDRETNVKEQADYDIILSHLIDEGYAESVDQAEAIMGNMSEEWRESIVEATYKSSKTVEPIEPADTRKVVTRVDQKGGTEAWKRLQAGDPGYVAAPHLKGV